MSLFDNVGWVRVQNKNNKFRIALIGRTNVGKSTLFNRLSGSRKALVFDRPGVTRDLKVADIDIFNKTAELVDVPGLFDYEGSDNDHPELLAEIGVKVHEAIESADLIVFVIDGAAGMSSYDREIASILRKGGSDVIVAVNKSERKSSEACYVDSLELGFKDVVRISAEHNMGIDDLIESIDARMPDCFSTAPEDVTEKADDVIRLSIVGRPNVGKSTLINKLLNEDVQMVADVDGVTRETSELDFEFKGVKLKLIDTPGVRRRANISDILEKISVSTTRKAFQDADVVICVIDAANLESGKLDRQDIKVISDVIDEGKPIVIAFNKLDKTPYGKNDVPEFIKNNFKKKLSQLKDVPFLFISAAKNINLGKMMDLALKTFKSQKKRVSTPHLNKVLAEINNSDILQSGSAKFKLKFMTQVSINPPTFIIFVRNKENIRGFHEKFIKTKLKESLGLINVPVSVFFKENSKKRT